MDEDPKIPWLNVWMIIVAAGGIWLAVGFLRSLYDSPMAWIGGIFMLLLLLFAGISAIAQWPGRSKAGTVLSEIGQMYADAWHTLWQQRWIVTAFGVVAAIRVVAALIDTPLTVLVRIRHPGAEAPNPFYHPWYHDLVSAAASNVTFGAQTVLGFLFPRAGISSHALSLVLASLVILSSLVWVRRRLNEVSNDPEYARDAQFLRALILPVAVVLVAVAIGASWDYSRMMSMQLRDVSSTAMEAMYTGYRATASLVLYSVGSMAVTAIASGILIAAVAVSLGRLRNGEQVTGETLTRDVVRYFAPTAGVYLILSVMALLVAVPSLIAPMIHPRQPLGPLAQFAIQVWPIIDLLFIFAPFAVLFHDTGAWRAVRRSILVWARKPLHALSFLAVGYSLLVLPMTLLLAGQDVVRDLAWVRVPYAVVYVLVSMLAIAYSTVAVWEFYWRVSGVADRVHKPE